MLDQPPLEYMGMTVDETVDPAAIDITVKNNSRNDELIIHAYTNGFDSFLLSHTLVPARSTATVTVFATVHANGQTIPALRTKDSTLVTEPITLGGEL